MDDKYLINNKFRLKITDKCNLNCFFCHAEGAPGVNDINVQDRTFHEAINLLRTIYNRIHITGGEPTIHKDLGKIVDQLLSLGYEVSMTSNGLFNIKRHLSTLSKLSYLNLSIHSLCPGYISLLSNNKYSEKMVSLIKQNIIDLKDILPIRINTVVTGKQQNIQELIDFASLLRVEIKLIPEWNNRVIAQSTIKSLLLNNKFELFEIIHIVPGSNLRKRYKNVKNQIIEVKEIDLFRPSFLCDNCSPAQTLLCQEGFSFLRLEDSPIRFRLCIFRHSEQCNTQTISNIKRMFAEISNNQ